MRLRTDERGVTVQIGTVLLFAVLVILLSIYQASVVPQQNEQVEFTHNQEVQSQLQDLRDDLLRTATTGSGGSASVALGTQYPVRAVFVNPAPPSGTLRTTPPANLTVENATASGETGDYWTGSARNFSTRGLTYDPLYHVYQNPPTTVYDNGVLYNHFDSANRTLAGQRLVDGDSISLVALNGSLSKSSSSTATMDLRSVSAATRTVAVGNESNNVSILVPTTLPADEWRGLLSAEMDETASNPDRYVRAVEEVPDRPAVRLVLEPATYELELAKVGVGTDVTDTDAHYVTDVRGDNASVAENSGRELLVEVRDRFDNPVSGATVNVTLDSGLGGDAIAAQSQRGDQLTDLTTDEEGRVEIRYDAPKNFDGSNRDVAVRVGMASVPPAGGDFDPGTRSNLSYNLTAVNTDGSGLDSEGGNGSDGAYQTRWDIPAIEAEPGMDCYDNGTCRYDRSVDSLATLTANTTPTAVDAPVEFSVNDTGVATFAADRRNTTSDGNVTVDLDSTATGVVNVYAASGGSGDALSIEVYDSDGTGPGSSSDAGAISVSDGSTRQDESSTLRFEIRNTANRDIAVTSFNITTPGRRNTGVQQVNEIDRPPGKNEVEITGGGADGTANPDDPPNFAGYDTDGTTYSLDTEAVLSGGNSATVRMGAFNDGNVALTYSIVDNPEDADLTVSLELSDGSTKRVHFRVTNVNS